MRHRRTPVGLLLDVDQTTKLQTGQAWHWGAVERGAVAQPVPDHGGDGGGGSSRILMVLLWSSGGMEEAAAVDAVVAVNSTEELGQSQGHS